MCPYPSLFKGRGWSWAEGRTYLVFDTGESDLHKAYLKNVPGVQPMTGTQLLEVIRKQIKDWGGVEFSNEKVVEIKKMGKFTRCIQKQAKSTVPSMWFWQGALRNFL